MIKLTYAQYPRPIPGLLLAFRQRVLDETAIQGSPH